MRPLLLILLALIQAPPSTVEGIAIKTGTTEPIAYARVMLTRVDSQRPSASLAETDERGRFVFRSVAPGAYRLAVQHEAFVRAAGQTLTVAPSQSVGDLVIAMTPTSVIAGRVVDEYGDPVPDVHVRASLEELTVETTTNDLGEYRLFGLPPGRYVLSAAPYLAPSIERDGALANGVQTGMIVVPTPPGPYSRGEGRGMSSLAQALRAGNFIPFLALRGEGHATVYYPGTTDVAAAAPIDVPAGAVLGGFTLTTRVRRAGP